MKEYKIQWLLKNYSSKWLWIIHYNKALNIYHEICIKVQKVKKISNRLYEVFGNLTEILKFDNNEIFILKNYENQNFILSEINLLSGNESKNIALKPKQGEFLFSKHKDKILGKTVINEIKQLGTD